MAASVKSKRGKNKLCYNGYLFLLNNIENNKNYWNCERSKNEGCRARLHTEAGTCNVNFMGCLKEINFYIRMVKFNTLTPGETDTTKHVVVRRLSPQKTWQLGAYCHKNRTKNTKNLITMFLWRRRKVSPGVKYVNYVNVKLYHYSVCRC